MATRIDMAEFGSLLASKFGSEVRVGDVRPFAKDEGVQVPSSFWQTPKLKRGVIDLSGFVTGDMPTPSPVAAAVSSEVAPAVSDVQGIQPKRNFSVSRAEDSEIIVPEKDKLYIAWGIHSRIEKIISKKIFFPVFVTGLSGNGKTMMVEQVCAKLNRKLVRVNFTAETDEDDLIGGYRMDSGTTFWKDGPVISAMREGAVLLLDEVSFGGARIMALQSILEGKGYLIKKTGEYVKPAKGFTIIAADNTKGKGSEDGRFAFTNVLNDAFLERFKMWFQQPYPGAGVEKRILNKLMSKCLSEVGEVSTDEDKEFITNLVKWGDITRKTFEEGALDDLITTRRLVGVVEAYSIFDRDRGFSVASAVERFDNETKQAFMDLYSKIDAGVDPEAITIDSSDPEDEFEF